MSKCGILATNQGNYFRCPSTPTKFHFHGYDQSAPFNVLIRGRLCAHRHTTAEAAQQCAIKKVKP